MAKSQRTLAKNTCWKWFSLYIRLRDCQRTLNSNEYGTCVTCGTPIALHLGDAGHFVPGRADSTLLEESNCHLQCKKCNRFRQGEFVKYEFQMRKLYGLQEIERLKQLTFSAKKYSTQEFRDMANKYRLLYKELLAK